MNVIAGQDLRASDNLYFLNTSSRVLLPQFVVVYIKIKITNDGFKITLQEDDVKITSARARVTLVTRE